MSNSSSIGRERSQTGHAITVGIASVAFAAALFTRRTGNVWLGVAIASIIAIGTAWLTDATPWPERRGWALARELAIGAVLGAAMALATHLLVPVALRSIQNRPPEPPKTLVEPAWRRKLLQERLLDGVWSQNV